MWTSEKSEELNSIIPQFIILNSDEKLGPSRGQDWVFLDGLPRCEMLRVLPRPEGRMMSHLFQGAKVYMRLSQHQGINPHFTYLIPLSLWYLWF